MFRKIANQVMFSIAKHGKWHDRKVLAVQRKGKTVIIGDGQLTHVTHPKNQVKMDNEKIIKQLSQNVYYGYASQLTQAFNVMEDQRGLFQIAPINKTLNKNVLSMAYTPGVGTVCLEIQKNLSLVDELTMRGRSVAIVTQGNCFKNQKIQPGKMTPVLDWCIAQIKYYSGVDSFPFIIRHGANMTNVLKDLSNSYGAILLLDSSISFNEKQIPNDVAIIRQDQICHLRNKQITDCEDTARILGYILQKKIRGIVGTQVLRQGLNFHPHTLRKQSTFFSLYRDGRDIGQRAHDFHKRFQGKIHIQLNFENISELKACFNEKNLIQFTKNRIRKNGYQNLSAIVTDGTAILGLGDIGPKPGLPVMQGKSLLFKVLGGVNVVPVCINKRKTNQQTIQAILDVASYFKAINLQDIKAPECFYVERGLKQKKILPVFHDDQHGTSIVTLAALINALKLVEKKFQNIKVVITGVGAAGITICRLLIQSGAKNIIMLDTKGAIYQGRKQGMNLQKQAIARITNPQKAKGSLTQIIKAADVFIGVSGPGTLTKQMVKTMNPKPIIFALANPDPQITPNDALQGGAYIYGSGRSDFKNQINNSLVFPGIFRGIHQHDLTQITDDMKLYVARLIADNIERVPNPKHIIADSLDSDIPIRIANGLKKFKHHEGKE